MIRESFKAQINFQNRHIQNEIKNAASLFQIQRHSKKK